jgi:4-hydroxybenzoate polyprenyltransferase
MGPCFAVTLYLANLALADSSGRLVVWGQIAIGVGHMLGPAAASILVDSTSLKAMIAGATFVYLLSLALAALSFRMRDARVAMAEETDHFAIRLVRRSTGNLPSEFIE